ncbi:Ig-like domain repeat protein [Nocardia sp. CA-145437]|uniref:Ig-like domain repeat protein n=1 Tax=Nocardia sp. CA-145437 TaxID=3239980 RepID=UPI003D955391
MRRIHTRRAAMIGATALLVAAPAVSLVHAEPDAPASPALPAALVAAIQRDLGLTPAQYLERADAGQQLAAFADSMRAKFPESFAGAWLDQAGAPMIGVAAGPDRAAARTAVEVAGYRVQDQPRSERTLLDQLGQLTGWIQNLPAALSGRVGGATIDPVRNDVALNVREVADGSSLQLPDFLGFVRTVLGPALGSAEPPTTTPPTTTTPKPPAGQSTITLNPITGATVDKVMTLTAKVSPAGAGGTVTFEDDKNSYEEQPVGADGTATMEWSPETAGKITVKAIFSGRDGVAGSTTTQQVTVAKAGGTTTTPKPTTTTPKPPAANAIMGGQGYDTEHDTDPQPPCSFGFNAVDGDGNVVNISAGHCDTHREDAGGAYATWVRKRASLEHEKVGEFDKVVVNGGDYALIKIDDSAAPRFKNNFVDTYGGDPVRITGTADPVVGAPVCKSGDTTQYTCGVITAVNVPINTGPHGAKVPNTFSATLCVIPGDSGGAMVTGTKALGIAVGTDRWECDGPKQSYGQPIKSILDANPGLKITTK